KIGELKDIQKSRTKDSRDHKRQQKDTFTCRHQHGHNQTAAKFVRLRIIHAAQDKNMLVGSGRLVRGEIVAIKYSPFEVLRQKYLVQRLSVIAL
ncbi:MAG: hypothetical protein AAGM67_05225, partial [Bacteroidota bacterium]